MLASPLCAAGLDARLTLVEGSTDDVRVNLTLTNTGDKPIRLLKWQLPGSEDAPLFLVERDGEKVGYEGNAVHLSGAALRSTGKRVFDIFTALGLDGLGRFSMNMTPMQPRNSANLRGVWAGDNAPAITAIWFAMN